MTSLQAASPSGPLKVLAVLVAVLTWSASAFAADLPSWNEGPAKAAIVDFVEGVTAEGGGSFVPPKERVAVFDNDGTLWSEQPVYFQFLFALDKAKELAAADPAWASTPALKAAASGDMKTIMAGGEKALVEIVGATHSGMTVEAFTAEVADWIAQAKHPQSGRLYTKMVFQPMLELLDYLTGAAEESPRNEFWYVNDDGQVVAARYDDWKVVFLENRGHAFEVWRGPFVELRVPLLFNLRRAPFEKAQHNSNTYNDWFLERAFVVVPIQALAARFLQTMRDHPPSQTPGSFNLSAIEAKLKSGLGN